MLLVYLPIILIGLYYYFTRTFNYWKKRNVVGPQPIAFFGNIKDSVFRKKSPTEVFTELYEKYPEEKVVGVYRMTTPCLLIRDLDIIKHVMIKDFDLFRDRGVEFSKQGLGNNLFHADGDTWAILRSRFNPIFTPGKLKNMFSLINGTADVFITHLEKDSRLNSEYNVNALTQKYTLSSIFACAFGVDYDGFHGKTIDDLMALDKIILTPNYALELDMMYPGLLKKLNLSLFPANVTKFFQKLVTDITAQRNGKPSARGDFMDLMLNLREMKQVNSLKTKSETDFLEITDDVMTAQAFVFYVGGYETSATTMSYLLYELAHHPEIQDKLRDEVNAILKAHNGELTYESLHEMKYLEKTFAETLRAHPIVDPLQRKARANYKLPGTDLVIEKDQMVLIPVRAIHYDEKYYPNPEIFDPERFEPEAVRARHPCAYLPFGAGQRNCIGLRFGSIQSRVCIAKMISKFRIEVCKNTKTPLDIDPNRILIGPSNGISLNIVPIDN